MQSNIRYRPESFNEIIGNKSTVDSLQAMFENKKVPHAILLSGNAGCGKTTIARIISKKLNCSETDLIEMNISNNRGIDTARDIIKNAPLSPMDGKVKVYIFDEVHRATKEFQDAMLKILEEPPDHVYFILCTTDPAKLLKTILSRCAKFEVGALNNKRMEKLLVDVLDDIGKQLHSNVMNEIIKKAEGVPRDALIMLDQVVYIKGADAQIDAIKKLKLSEAAVIDLCRALYAKKNWKVVAGILKELEADPEQIRRAILGYFSKVLLNNPDARTALILDSFKNHVFDSGMAGIILACYSVIEL